ncbi:MAG TPA: hypothetical protein VLB76_06565 [Thermoanaerobaculia bacterium]|jgi:hypothetical protein|nr:hypothetical protein [Thermoanaerobaculia bacterium]
MDPLTLATITGVTSAAKTTLDAILAVLSKGKGRDAEKAAKEALGLVSDLQARLLQFQEIALRLQEENAQLRAEIRQKEEGATERKQYERKTVGRSVVLVREDEPGNFYCPTCMEVKKHAIPLQPHPMRSGSFGSHFCSQCETSYRLRG